MSMASLASLLLALPLALGGAEGSLDKIDTNFLHDAALSGLCNVRTSTDALKRSSLSTGERELAQQMIDEHQKVNKELTALAAKKNVTVPGELDDTLRKKTEKLAASEDKGFPERYLECQVDDHRKAVKLFEEESSDGKDVDIRDFANRTLPHLRAHLAAAKALEEKH